MTIRGKREAGSGKREAGSGKREAGSGKREAGSGRRETGDGRRETEFVILRKRRILILSVEEPVSARAIR
jgi:hypothetical protein